MYRFQLIWWRLLDHTKLWLCSLCIFSSTWSRLSLLPLPHWCMLRYQLSISASKNHGNKLAKFLNKNWRNKNKKQNRTWWEKASARDISLLEETSSVLFRRARMLSTVRGWSSQRIHTCWSVPRSSVESVALSCCESLLARCSHARVWTRMRACMHSSVSLARFRTLWPLTNACSFTNPLSAPRALLA